jgi:predicted metal-dependent hydrolase
MQKHIELYKRQVPYTLRVSRRARRLRLCVYCDGALVVTTPRNLHISAIEGFIIRKSKWVLDKIDHFRSFSGSFVRAQRRTNTKAEFLEHKHRALSLVQERVAKYNEIYKFKFNKINIRNQKTRWGSCSHRGNLSFNYKIALLPERLADYIVVHELCHLGEFNHSKNFWSLVARVFPDYPDIKRELKQSGLRLS